MISHYKCNDNLPSTNVIDAQGTNNLVASFNTGTRSTPDAKIDRCLDFVGTSDDYASKANVVIPDSGTIAFWIKADMGDQIAENIYPVGWQVKMAIYGPSAGVNEASGLLTYDGADYRGYNWGDQSIYDDTWHNYVVTWNATVVRLYLDGAKVGADKAHANEIAGLAPGPIAIGGGWASNYGNHTGKLDDVRFYSKELSINEIKGIYNLGYGTEGATGCASSSSSSSSFSSSSSSSSVTP